MRNTYNSQVLKFTCALEQNVHQGEDMTASEGVSEEKPGFWWKVDKYR